MTDGAPRRSVTLYAHRGASAERPENTMAAFERGLELGADAIETDVHLTADGHVVVAHDPDGRRMAGVDAEIRRSTLAEVRRWDVGKGFRAADGSRPFVGGGYGIPTLEEVLVDLGRGVRINVDVKQREPSMVEAVVTLVRRLGAEERVLLTSFHAGVVREIRSRGYGGETGLAEREVMAAVFLPGVVLGRIWGGGRERRAVQVPVRAMGIDLTRRGLVEKWKGLGWRVDYWVINEVEEARRLVAGGADGIMTDDPGKVGGVLKGGGCG